MLAISKVRQVLQLPATQDAETERLRDAVVAMFEEATGLLWNRRKTHSQVIDNPDRWRELELELSPVMGISSVQERSGWSSSATYSTLDILSVRLIGDRRLRKLTGSFDTEVKVVYAGGWDEASVPKDVEAALLAQAQFMSQRWSKENIAVSQKAIEQATTSFLEADMHPAFRRAVLQRARKF